MKRTIHYILGITLILTIKTFGQQRLNKLGQIEKTICLKFKKEESKKLDKALVRTKKGSKFLRNKNEKGVSIGIPPFDIVSRALKIESVKRVFRPSGKNEEKHRKAGLHLWYEIKYESNTTLKEAIKQLRSSKSITIAHEVYPIKNNDGNKKITSIKEQVEKVKNSVVSDPRYKEQWHYNNTGQKGGTVGRDIHLEEAWQIEKGDRRVIVAINDTGLDTNHPDLKGNLWVNEDEIPNNGKDDDNNGYVDDVHGYDFTANSGNIPALEHGTHVAGTVAAETNNGIGVAGVAGGTGKGDGVRLMACKILLGAVGDMGAEAFVYAADNGAIISQNSWMYWAFGAGDARVPVLEEAMDYFKKNAGGTNKAMSGGIIFFAAGNENRNISYIPHNLDRQILVAALNNKDEKTGLTNFGKRVAISAPGAGTGIKGILSTTPNNNYGFLQGTSMACPHVSGVAALVVSNNYGNINPEQLKRILLETTDPIEHINPNYNGMLGTGRLNAYKALQVGNGEGIPLGIRLEEKNRNTARLAWNSLQGISSYTVRYKKVESSNWSFQNVISNRVDLNNLEEGKEYEFQVSIANSNAYSYIFTFITKVLNLEVPTGIIATNITDRTAELNWKISQGAEFYELDYKKINTNDWSTITIEEGTKVRIEGLDQDTTYEVRVKAINQNIISEYSNLYTFTTKKAKCGAIPIWEPKSYRVKGTQVAYNNIIYQNKWWAQLTDTPGKSSVWEKVRECGTVGNQQPQVTIINPSNGQIIEQETPESITLTVDASDNDGTIVSIQFEVNNVSLIEGNNVEWTPTSFGNYKIKATVIDDKGALAFQEINITIKKKTLGNQSPQVTITSPINGEVIEQKTLESITLVANASDADGTIESVLFEVNDNKLSEGNNKSWTPVNFGDYKIKVTVVDNKGATGSDQINITIKEKTIGATCEGITEWNANTEYKVKGIQVAHKGSVYESKWWTKNEEPGTGGNWGSWQFTRLCSQDKKEKKLTKVYPTPVDETLNVKVNSPNVKITLYDINGKLIKVLHKGNLNGNIFQYDVSSLPKGIYLLQLKTLEQVERKKVIIK
ncbi:S8 family serine peptidase [Tenacibaculum sp. 190524A02b]|uniref:S8 family serine peptidase n=1 Tax=Tenacibaculum vairaonense TaxID=3137860 RepID=UPI0031FA66FF